MPMQSFASPAISVVMPTYDTPISDLRRAVESILNQTFRDFEFIIIDDGSTNGSDEYLKSLQDERVKIIWNPQNLGVSKSLNIGLQHACGKYIARMDADDISLPTRLEKQFAFLETHPNVVLVGTRHELFGLQSRVVTKEIKSQSSYRVEFLFHFPGPQHPTVLIRRETLVLNNITYDEEALYAEDYVLYIELCRYGEIATLPEVLVKKQEHEGQVSHRYNAVQRQTVILICKRLFQELGLSATEEELELHYKIGHLCKVEKKDRCRAIKWILKLLRANMKTKIYNQRELAAFSFKRLVLSCFPDACDKIYK